MKRAPPLKCKVRNVQLFQSRDFVWLLIYGKATKLGGWVWGRGNEEVFGLFEPASFPWFVLPFTWTNRRFTYWANGNQNSRLVNFLPESRLPFARIGFIDRNTARQRW